MSNLSGKVAYITGGSKGIGYEVGKSMAASGIRVAITSRQAKGASEAAHAINAIYPNMALGIVSDVSNFHSEEAAVAQVLQAWGKIDILVANAGVGHFASIEDLTADQWNKTINTNLTGVFHSVKACLPALKESEGYLFTIASLAGANFFATGAAYNASKFGLVGFTQAVMLDVRQYGIKTTVIMPGSVATTFNDRVPTEADSWKIQPEDIGQMVVDLLRLPARTLPSKVEIRPTKPPVR